jgi:GPI mannosyltransferase 3
MLLESASYRKISFAGLFVLLITAIFSSGYNNFDEHFQILEFSNYKMGYSPASQLAWEYNQQIRPALQPFIAYILSKGLETAGLYNPFTVALLLRVMMALVTWLVLRKLIANLLPEFDTTAGRRIFVLGSYFLWFVAYIGVRFSAENLGSALFFLGLCLLPGIDKSSRNQSLRLLVAGILFGFTFFARVQIGFAFIGLAIWMLFIKKLPVRQWLLITIGALIASAMCVVLDYWLYGAWVFTPYNYFNVNLLQNKASEFGVQPPWQYFIYFIESAVPPLSIALLLLLVAGIVKKPLHLFSLVLITFVIGHSIIGHKEVRFLFPVTYALIFLAAIGYEMLHLKYTVKKMYKVLFTLVVITNFGVLAYRMMSPADSRIPYYRYIYKYAQAHDAALIAFEKSPYNVVTLETNFYKPKQLDIIVLASKADLVTAIDTASKKYILVFNPDLSVPKELVQYSPKRVFTQFPEWILSNNVNNWQERSNIWALYEVKK